MRTPHRHLHQDLSSPVPFLYSISPTLPQRPILVKSPVCSINNKPNPYTNVLYKHSSMEQSGLSDSTLKFSEDWKTSCYDYITDKKSELTVSHFTLMI